MEDRRTFLNQITAAGVSLAFTPMLACAKKNDQEKQNLKTKGPRVVLVQNPKMSVKGPNVQREEVRRMLEIGICKLAGTNDVRAALAYWIRPVDTVGLKVNCLAGRQMSTHLELIEEFVALLEKTGVPRKQAIVFDRSDNDLRSAGFDIRTSGKDYQCVGNDRAGYEKDMRVMPSGASRFSRVATQTSSVIVNIPIIKDHGITGITGALKNNFGLIHNPNKFHLNGCDPHVAEVNELDFVRGKQGLFICDAFRIQIEGGPAYHPSGIDVYKSLLVSNDPVALDMVIWDIVEELRKKKKLPSLTKEERRPKHIFTAAKHGLGVADRNKIEIIKVTVS